MAKHPAKYTDKFIPIFAELLRGLPNVLDPMAGTCKITEIRDYGYDGEIYCNELELEWASMGNEKSVVTTCDAASLPYSDGFFHAICTSPVYGNRISDHHNARDSSRRNTYTHVLGRNLQPENTGKMQWGKKYRTKHEAIWRECWRVLKSVGEKEKGLLILNISNHIRKGMVIPVTEWHVECLLSIGFSLVDHIKIDTPRLKFGANMNARVDYESILIFRKN